MRPCNLETCYGFTVNSSPPPPAQKSHSGKLSGCVGIAVSSSELCVLPLLLFSVLFCIFRDFAYWLPNCFPKDREMLLLRSFIYLRFYGITLTTDICSQVPEGSNVWGWGADFRCRWKDGGGESFSNSHSQVMLGILADQDGFTGVKKWRGCVVVEVRAFQTRMST